jgi:alpha-glucosidase
MLPNGIEVRSGRALLQAVALRDDVIRIRIARDGVLPEDSSWSVLPASRRESIGVTPESSPDFVGFQTKLLRVKVRRQDFRLSVTDLQGNVLQEDAEGWPVEFHEDAFRIYKQMPADEHYFGLGDKVGPLDRRNQSFVLWNTDAYRFQESTDPIYKSIPFFLSMRAGRTVGVLFDNTWCSSFDFGKQMGGIYSFGAENGPIDYYLLYGPDAKQVLSTYRWLTGPVPLPPLWSLGYQQSRFSYGSEAEVRAVASRLRADKIPADALYLDIDFQSNFKPFTVAKDRFPAFSALMGDLKKDNFHVVAITDLHIASLPNAGYAPYDSGSAGGHFVKDADGSDFVGKVWPGPSVFPDFTQQRTRDWWGTLYKPFVADGVAGFWNDMNEPSVFNGPGGTMPDEVRHRIDEPGFRSRIAGHREIHNVYGMENSRATYEGLLKISPDLRPFVLTRATYAGGQRYASTWTGDNSSTWNHLRLSTPMLENLGLSGFGFSGADVGGFIGSPSADLLTKWIELGTFQPIDRNHSEKGTANQEPWVHGTEQENIRRRYIEERYRLLPYIYSTVEQMARTGTPVVRPLFLEFPFANADGKPFDLEAGNEFMFGSDLLVAPSPYPDQTDSYEVKFPASEWYDYWTGERVDRGVGRVAGAAIKPYVVRPELPTLPVFVRAGSILPMQALTQSTEEKPAGPLLLDVYPGRDCSGSLYQDDGKSLAFQHGDFLRIAFTCEILSDSIKVRIGSHQGSYPAWWQQVRIEVHGWNADTALSLVSGQDKPIPATVDRAHHTVSVAIPDTGQGADIEIRSPPGK